MFAQTGSAVLPRFLGAGVSAVCAEPYPFFWLDGGPGTIHRYGADDGGPRDHDRRTPPSPPDRELLALLGRTPLARITTDCPARTPASGPSSKGSAAAA